MMGDIKLPEPRVARQEMSDIPNLRGSLLFATEGSSMPQSTWEVICLAFVRSSRLNSVSEAITIECTVSSAQRVLELVAGSSASLLDCLKTRGSKVDVGLSWPDWQPRLTGVRERGSSEGRL